MNRVRSASVAAAVLAAGVVNAVAGGLLVTRLRQSPFTDAGFEVTIGVTVSAAGIAITGWWVLCLVVTVVAELRRRRTGRMPCVPGVLSPRFMRRLVGVLLSAHLLAGAPTAVAVATPEPPMVTAPADPVPGITATSSRLPVLDGPAVPAPAPGADPWFVPRAPALPDGAPLVRPPTRADPPTATTTATVMAGDSLWTLAARQLGPLATDLEVARQWPRWHALNRAVIGPDPGLIRPGQVLRIPPARPGGEQGEGR